MASRIYIKLLFKSKIAFHLHLHTNTNMSNQIVSNLAKPEELQENENSKNFFLEFFQNMQDSQSTQSIQEQEHIWYNSMLPEHRQCFKRLNNNTQLLQLYQVCNNFCGLIKQSNTNKKIPLSKRAKFVKSYNNALNKLRGKLVKGTRLDALLFYNKDAKYVSNSEPKVRERNDVLVGGTLDTSNYVLRICGDAKEGMIGGRCAFENGSILLACLNACLEKAKYDDLVMEECRRVTNDLIHNTITFADTRITFAFKLRLKLPPIPVFDGGDGEERWIYSNSNRITHILCEKLNPHHTCDRIDTLFPLYYRYTCAVKSKVMQLISEAHNNPNCEFAHIHCCRLEPVCNRSMLVLKTTRDVFCDVCQFEICCKCGKASHGGDCDLSVDEASAELIANTSKACPNQNCRMAIFKYDGCNHMTCSRCQTQFCFSCGLEFLKDSRNHYMVSEHYRDNGIGDGRCNQFS